MIMTNFKKPILLLIAIFSISGCARDLSSSTYTSDSTLNIVLEGIIVSSRDIKIKESDRLSDNSIGAVGGGLGGGILAHSSGGGGGAIVGGAIGGAVIGALAQDAFSSAKGTEFIVKVDKSKFSDDYYEGSALMRNAISAAKATGMVTIIQKSEKDKSKMIQVGENVLVIISENRARVIRDVSK
jgi:outer membrane lipoprotein SlyB